MTHIAQSQWMNWDLALRIVFKNKNKKIFGQPGLYVHKEVKSEMEEHCETVLLL